MATTTNYGWTTPDDTDLVKDGAAAIRTLGSSVDTTTKNLNPETTLGDMSFRSATSNVNTRLPIGSSGQHLTVVAGVPAWATASDQTPLTTKGDIFTFSTLDTRLGVGANGTVLQADSAEATGLKWATPSDQTPLTTKGDLFTFSTVDARLGVGANGTTLVADSSEATGLKWAAPAGGGKVLQVVEGVLTGNVSSSSATFADTGLTVTITPTLNTSKVLVIASCSSVMKTAVNTNVGLKLLRGATQIFYNDYIAHTGGSVANNIGSVSLVKLDSPATTSATTYKVQMANMQATGVTLINEYAGAAGNTVTSSIIAMEIGA